MCCGHPDVKYDCRMHVAKDLPESLSKGKVSYEICQGIGLTCFVLFQCVCWLVA